MIWISYILAIVVDPGSPPLNFKPEPDQWRRWCRYCHAYKPERTHHSKQMGRCILKMDHYCPWTCNAVGFKNLPHFIRFLVWVELTTGFVLFFLLKRAYGFYTDADLPAYLIPHSEIIFTILLIPFDLFVFFTIFVLFLREAANMFSGKTQIEQWEEDRMMSQLRHGVLQRHIDPILKDFSDPPPEINSMDDILFPYDISMWDNIVNAMGPVYLWLWPWGKPKGDGLKFEKNEWIDPIIGFGLPWPLDLVNEDAPEDEPEIQESPRGRSLLERILSKEKHIPKSEIDTKHLSLQARIKRKKDDDFYRRDTWTNYEGEKIEDLGVQI